MDHRITPSLRIGTSHGKLCVVGCMWKPLLYSPGCRLLIVYCRPQRSCGQGNVFTGVCLSTGGCLPQCMLGCHTPLDGEPPGWRNPPWDQVDPPTPHPQPPDGESPPGPGRPPRWRTPPDGEPPRDQADPPDGEPPQMEKPPPPREADSSIRSTSGRYASY